MVLLEFLQEIPKGFFRSDNGDDDLLFLMHVPGLPFCRTSTRTGNGTVATRAGEESDHMVVVSNDTDPIGGTTRNDLKNTLKRLIKVTSINGACHGTYWNVDENFYVRCLHTQIIKAKSCCGNYARQHLFGFG